jgi:hypothetical protein
MFNKISFTIPDAVITDVTEKLTAIDNALRPYMIALTPAERQEIPKMGDGTFPFVQKCLSYCQSNPEFSPPFINFEELLSDMKVYEQLIPLYRIVFQLENKLNDTSMEAGAESYMSALAYYNSVKLAAKSDVPGAKAIYEDLKKRFAKEKAAIPVPENN